MTRKTFSQYDDKEKGARNDGKKVITMTAGEAASMDSVSRSGRGRKAGMDFPNTRGIDCNDKEIS